MRKTSISSSVEYDHPTSTHSKDSGWGAATLASVASVWRQTDSPMATMMTVGSSTRRFLRDSQCDQESGKTQRNSRKAVFLDRDEMRKNILKQEIRSEYDVSNFYKKHGVWQAMAKSAWLDRLSMLIIIINALWIAYDTDENDSALLT